MNEQLLNQPITGLVATEVTFKDEKELLAYFGLKSITFAQLKSDKVPYRAEIKFQHISKAIGVPLFPNDDGSYRTIINRAGVETEVGNSRDWKDSKGVKRQSYDLALPNIVLEYAVMKANAQLGMAPKPKASPKPKATKTVRKSKPVSGDKPF